MQRKKSGSGDRFHKGPRAKREAIQSKLEEEEDKFNFDIFGMNIFVPEGLK